MGRKHGRIPSTTGHAHGFAGVAGAGNIPMSLSPVAWFRGDLGVTLNGSNVSAWADQSGHGNNVSQGTGANQPPFTASNASYNNQPTFTCTGAQCLKGAASGWGFNTPLTVCVVGNTPTVVGNAYFNDFNSNACIIQEFSSNTGTSIYDGTQLQAASHFTANTPSAIVAVHNNTTSALYISALTAKASGTENNLNPPLNGTLTIGNSGGGGQPVGGPIAEFIVYSRVLNSSEISTILNYFGSRYNISIGA